MVRVVDLKRGVVVEVGWIGAGFAVGGSSGKIAPY